MRRIWTYPLALALVAAVLAGGAVAAQKVAGPAAVDSARLLHAGAEPEQWLSDGRTYSAQRYSPLTQINQGNVGKLGLAWYADLNTYRGAEASPIEVDGVLYNISAWSITTAYDGATGKVLWTYDPKVPAQYARLACCGPVSRGVVAWHGKIILGALDGRMIALDAKTGQPVWSVDTKDPGQPLSITGAPRIADGNVVVGPGAEGILTLEQGNVNIFTDQSLLLAQSRVFTEQGGNMVIWSSNGDINAGKGAKTIADVPPPVYVSDDDHYNTLDARGEVTGAGIATLQTIPDAPPGSVSLIAPRGTVDAGSAGIRV